MAYTQENIDNIKRYGDLDGYIEHAQKLISSLSDAQVVVEPGDAGCARVRLAHLWGDYVVGDHAVDACLLNNEGGQWSRSWPRASFVDRGAAEAYARAAVTGELKAFATRLLAEAKSNLAALEAAR